MKKILITGGAGYVGTVLTHLLLDKGYKVVVYDTLFYGCYLDDHPSLSVVQGDIRNQQLFRSSLKGVDAVIHLACISNDPSFHLDESLSKTINYDCFEMLVIEAKKAGVKRFINASSSSVYGVSSQPNVTEDHPLVPLSLYNKYKGLCEPLLFKHQSQDFVCVNIRPATICGYSPRMRLDLSVNILTHHAVVLNKITVFGGEQLRPNLHIRDMCDLYLAMLEIPQEKIAGETFNYGFQNYSMNEIANIVKRVVLEEFPEKINLPIEVQHSDDKRSYHICSKKIEQKLGIVPKFTLEDAVRDMCHAYRSNKLKNTTSDVSYSNVKTLMAKGIK
jgi:nucleoside-diphosphate-sugar epimerase